MPGGQTLIFFLSNAKLVVSNFSDLTPADINCTYGVQWIYSLMGQCVMDARGMAAVAFGFICLIAWMINGIPQMIENFRRGIPDQAVSPFLLLFWTLGDVCNLLGCILSHQLVLQTVISVYSIASDIILVSQYLYYRLRHRTMLQGVVKRLEDGHISPDFEDSLSSRSLPVEPVTDGYHRDDHRVLVPVFFLGMFGLIFWNTPANYSQPVHPVQLSHRFSPTTRQLLQTDEVQTSAVITPWLQVSSHVQAHPEFLDGTSAKIGYSLGCFSCGLYLLSRFPQIYQNWRRGSTDGVSLGLFCLAVLGNSSYGLQIFLTSTESLYLLRATPWIIGSLGVLFLDLLILYQFYFYAYQQRRRYRPVHVLDGENSPPINRSVSPGLFLLQHEVIA